MEPGGSGVLILLGVGIFGGVLNAVLFKKLSIPQVLGYMAVGLILGQTGFKFIDAADLVQLSPINLFCLTVIGFLVGSEIRFGTMKKYGGQFASVLMSEGLTAFVFVWIGTGAVLFMVTGNVAVSVAGGLMLGAIASATDPASTISVLWEYRAAGVLTATITAIVALDDALAMSLYGIGNGVSRLLTGGDANLVGELGRVSVSIFGAIAVGCFAGAVATLIAIRSSNAERPVVSTIGMLLLITGICSWYDLDVIMAAMAAGVTVVNWQPARSERLISGVKAFGVPIYILFFVFVGARLRLAAMPNWLWGVVIMYVIGRSGGKILGTYMGAKWSHADPVVSKYGGVGILAQGGVAIGLAIVASHHLSDVAIADGLSLGDTVIFGVTATTFLVQLVGPAMTKLSIKLAGEMNRRITDEDLLAQLKASDAASTGGTTASPTTSLGELFKIFASSRYHVLPIIDEKGGLADVVTFDSLRDSIVDQETWDWVIATDVAEEPRLTVQPGDSLSNVVAAMDQAQVQDVIVAERGNQYRGILNRSDIRAVLRRRAMKQKA